MSSTHRTKPLLNTSLILTLLLAAATGWAKPNPMINAGVGTTMGVSHVTPLSGGTTSSFSNDFSIRMKALYVLGLEFGLSPTDSTPTGDLVFQNSLRLSGLIYILPTPHVSAYFKGGIEGDDLGAIFSTNDPSNAYHLGGGIDIELGHNVVLGLEFLVLIPGKNSVEKSVESYVNGEADRVAALAAQGIVPTDVGADAPEVSDFISASNFRFTLGARYYF